MALPSELKKQITDILSSLPCIDDINGQKAFLYSAGLDQEIQDQIQVGVPTTQFVQLLVSNLIKYEKLNNGRYPLEVILETAKSYVGQDKKKDCEILIHELQKSIKEPDDCFTANNKYKSSKRNVNKKSTQKTKKASDEDHEVRTFKLVFALFIVIIIICFVALLSLFGFIIWLSFSKIKI